MAFSSGGNQGPMAEINVTPLVDVMLVLLIIFIVTAPILTYPITVDLPQQVDTPPPVDPPQPITLRIDGSSQIYWNGQLVTEAQLQEKMVQVVAQNPKNQPQIQIDSDPQAEYEIMAKVLAAAKNAQLTNIGFLQK